MGRPTVGVSNSSGKKVKRVISTGRASVKGKARKPERVNLSNTYGIRGGGTGVNVDKPGGLKGAVTQGKPRNKHSVAKAKGKIRG